MRSPDILIIGGGVAGLAGALALLRRGASVTVADSSAPGAASWSGGGILAPLPPWSAVPAVQALARRGAEMFPEWLISLGAERARACELRRCGMLAVAPLRAESQFAAWRENNRAEWVEAKDFAPKLNFPENARAAWLPDVCQVRPPRVLKALKNFLRESPDATLLSDSIVGLKSAGGKIVAATGASRREYSAGHFVVSAGAWSAQFAPHPQPDIRPLRGHMALYQRSEADGLGELGGRIILFGDGLYLIPRADGLLLAGGGMEDAGFDANPNPDATAQLRARAEGTIPGLSAPERVWAGLRPATPGNIPVVEKHPARENLYFHTGHFRYGMTIAPATAETLADMINGKFR